MACEKCWGDAYTRTMSDPSKTQAEHYSELLLERSSNPCTVWEQGDSLAALRRVMDAIHSGGNIWYDKGRLDAYSIVARCASDLRREQR